MKRLAAITISLLSAVSAFGGITAYAAEGDTVYPVDESFIKSLDFSSLTDYAVDGDIYAFADGKKISVYSNGDLTEYTFTENVLSLDCSDGIFYYSDPQGTYSLPDKQSADYVIPEKQTVINLGNYTYRLTDNTLEVADFESKEIVSFDDESYSNLKIYGNVIYAVSGNELYSFIGTEKAKISLSYADYTVTDEIAVGQAAANLKNYSALKFVNIEKGAYMTEVDLTDLDGDYFITDATVAAQENTVALLLGYSGNAALIAIGDASYILLKSKVQEVAVNCYTEPEFDNATITGNRIYASPYVIIGTSSLANAAGTIVSVLNKLEYEGVLGSAYYEVLYMTENSTKVGYVADGFLTEYIIEDNKEPTEIPDPDHNEKNNTTPVLLVLAVIVLVLIAVGYLAYVGTRGKKKDKKKDDTSKNDK